VQRCAGTAQALRSRVYCGRTAEIWPLLFRPGRCGHYIHEFRWPGPGRKPPGMPEMHWKRPYRPKPAWWHEIPWQDWKLAWKRL